MRCVDPAVGSTDTMLADAFLAALSQVGITPLHIAVLGHNSELLAACLDEGADVALGAAVRCCSRRGIGTFVVVSHCLMQGLSPLHLAADVGFEAGIQPLVERGAVIDATDEVRLVGR